MQRLHLLDNTLLDNTDLCELKINIELSPKNFSFWYYMLVVVEVCGGCKDMCKYLQRWSCSAASGKDSGYK